MIEISRLTAAGQTTPQADNRQAHRDRDDDNPGPRPHPFRS